MFEIANFEASRGDHHPPRPKLCFVCIIPLTRHFFGGITVAFMALLPTRLVICVDGTTNSVSSSSIETNIRRIRSSLQQGAVTDSITGNSFNQVVIYLPGIGSARDLLSRDRLTGALSYGYLKQIQDVYDRCSRLSPQDEVWLFGFSGGAFVVRAVAGLLHNFGAITSAGQTEFSRDFKRMLKDLEASSLTRTMSVCTRPAPIIRFIGVFETIKAINEDIFDISFNRSICHMRQALALHEDRKSLLPEVLAREEFSGSALRDNGRSLIQAYFAGQHDDIGGAAKKQGLALYPCQWILLEARQCGLAVDIVAQAADEPSPQSAVFPRSRKDKRQNGSERLWSFRVENGIVTSMQDLREVHGLSRGNEKSRAVKLTSSRLGSIRQKKPRDPFTAVGWLRGYCDWAPQGTIIHPSVYLLLDEHVNVALETKELKLQRYIEDWRDRMLGAQDCSNDNPRFWLDDDRDEDSNQAGAIRVLVCGNTGTLPPHRICLTRI